MKRYLTALVIACILLSVFPFQIAAAAYHTKNEMINMFKNLCEDYPDVASYEVIGKSHLGNDIYMFKFGNMSGGRVLWDAQLHGNEDAGSEIGYWFAQWLLTNNTELTNGILKESCFMVIPVVNPDSTGRTNANRYNGTVRYGVNLNRNFVTGWGQSGSTDKSGTDYRGPSAGSEKETQVMRSAFSRYKPRFYVDTHMWGGPVTYSYRNNDPATVNALKTGMDQLKSEYSGTPYSLRSIGGEGFAIADAGILGIQSFLLEINDETTPNINTLKSSFYPNCRLMLLAMFDLVYPMDTIDYPPVTEDDYDGEWHTADFIISLTASDTEENLAETYYKIGSGTVKTVSADGQPRITTEGSNNTLEYWSVDSAENEETHHVLTDIKLDKTTPAIETPSRTPTGDIQPDQPVKISVNITDITSNVKNVTLSYTTNDGASWTDLPMSRNSSDSPYEATILGQPAGTMVRYKIDACNYAGANMTLDGMEPYLIYQTVTELQSFLVLPLFIVATLLAVIICRRERDPE